MRGSVSSREQKCLLKHWAFNRSRSFRDLDTADGLLLFTYSKRESILDKELRVDVMRFTKKEVEI